MQSFPGLPPKVCAEELDWNQFLSISLCGTRIHCIKWSYKVFDSYIWFNCSNDSLNEVDKYYMFQIHDDSKFSQ